MGNISITINLNYIFIPLIFFISYYLIKFFLIVIVKYYLKRKYYKVIEPEIYKIIHETILYIDESKTKGIDFNQRVYLTDKINQRMLEILPKRVKLGGELPSIWGNDIDGSYITQTEILAKLIFPYWRSVVTYEIKGNIWIDREEILKKYRENSIDNILSK